MHDARGGGRRNGTLCDGESLVMCDVIKSLSGIFALTQRTVCLKNILNGRVAHVVAHVVTYFFER